MSGFMVFCVIGAFFIALAILLLTGRGAFLLAGYNTKPESEREKYDAKAMCKFMGKILLPMGILAPFAGIESIASWSLWVWIATMSVLLVFAVVYANTGNRFKKGSRQPKHSLVD